MPCSTVVLTLIFSLGCLGIFFPVLFTTYENKLRKSSSTAIAIGTPICPVSQGRTSGVSGVIPSARAARS